MEEQYDHMTINRLQEEIVILKAERNVLRRLVSQYKKGLIEISDAAWGSEPFGEAVQDDLITEKGNDYTDEEWYERYGLELGKYRMAQIARKALKPNNSAENQ